MFGGPEFSYHQTYSARDWLSFLRTPYPTQNLQRKHRTWYDQSIIYSPTDALVSCLYYHHHHHVHERLGVFLVPWSSRWTWSLRLFLGHLTFLRPYGWYGSNCLVILFVSILCTCCSHFSSYWVVLKITLKFTLQQLRYVSMLQL